VQPVREMHLPESTLPISLLPSGWTYTPIPGVTSILVTAASHSSGRSKRVTWDDTPRVRIIPARDEIEDFEMDADDADSEASSDFEENVPLEDESVASSDFEDDVPVEDESVASSDFDDIVPSEDGSVASSAFDDNVPLPSSGSDFSLVGTLPSQRVSVSSWLSGMDSYAMYEASGWDLGDYEDDLESTISSEFEVCPRLQARSGSELAVISEFEVSLRLLAHSDNDGSSEIGSQDDSSSENGSLASDVSSAFEELPLQLSGMTIASSESGECSDVESVASSDFEELVVSSVSSIPSIPVSESEVIAVPCAGVEKLQPSRIPVATKKGPTRSCLSFVGGASFDKLVVRKDSCLPIRANAGSSGMASIPFSLRVFGSGTVGNLGVRLWTPELAQRESAAAYLRVSRYEFRIANRGIEFPEPGSGNLPEFRIDSTYVTWDLEMMNQRRERSAAATALSRQWIPDGEDVSIEQVSFPTILKKAIACTEGYLIPYSRGVLVEVLDSCHRRAVQRAQELETRRAGWEAAARLAREDLSRERAEQNVQAWS